MCLASATQPQIRHGMDSHADPYIRDLYTEFGHGDDYYRLINKQFNLQLFTLPKESSRAISKRRIELLQEVSSCLKLAGQLGTFVWLFYIWDIFLIFFRKWGLKPPT